MGGRPLNLWDPVSASSLCLALPVSTAPKSCRVFSKVSLTFSSDPLPQEIPIPLEPPHLALGGL